VHVYMYVVGMSTAHSKFITGKNPRFKSQFKFLQLKLNLNCMYVHVMVETGITVVSVFWYSWQQCSHEIVSMATIASLLARSYLSVSA